jgi:pSer/pThr/pTyr-binding forkhead associated (FHA) protein
MSSNPYRLSLRVVNGPHAGKLIRVPRLPFVIGRSSDCHLRPASDSVHERHCALVGGTHGKLLLRDLGSATGTFLNGALLASEVAVGDGDELVIGPLRFELLVEEQPVTQGSLQKN